LHSQFLTTAIRIRDDVAFFQAVRAAIAKTTGGDRKSAGDLDHAIRQLVSKAVASDGVVDIFAAAGLKTPDISILSDEFLAEVRGMQHKNLAVELLRKLLNDEVKARSRHNLVQARSFAELLEKAVRRYQNRAIEAAQVIEELIDLAKQMREAQKRGEKRSRSTSSMEKLASARRRAKAKGSRVAMVSWHISAVLVPRTSSPRPKSCP
jgi:type I restriction enzyme R subunit